MDDAGSLAVSFSLGRAEADEFLRRITEDDDYRELFKKDPVGALGRHGITISGDAVPEEIELPPKGEVNWLFGKSQAVAAIKPAPPTFGSCLIWGICVIVAAQASERDTSAS